MEKVIEGSKKIKFPVKENAKPQVVQHVQIHWW